MQLKRIEMTTEASNLLRSFQGRTGLTPNIICRIGFCLSLRDTIIPDPNEYQEDDREFNLTTLLGDHADLYIALLRQWCSSTLPSGYVIEDYFRAHMNRGVILIGPSARNGIEGIVSLCNSDAA